MIIGVLYLLQVHYDGIVIYIYTIGHYNILGLFITRGSYEGVLISP